MASPGWRVWSRPADCRDPVTTALDIGKSCPGEASPDVIVAGDLA